jgi:hypothetical protein
MAGDQKAFGFLLMLANNVEPAGASATSSATTPEQDLAIIADYISRQSQKGDAK